MSWPGSLKAAFGITFFALFLQIAGFVLPWWFVFGDGIYIGIWYIVGCPSGIASLNCSVVAYSATDNLYNTADANSIAGNIFFTILQIVVTVAVGFILISFLSLMFAGCAGSKSKCPYVMACVLLFFSAIFVLAVVGFFAWMYTTLLVVITDYKFDARTFPWSVLSSGVGGILTFIAFIVLAISLCNWRTDDDYDDDDDDRHLPMSNINDKRGYDNPRYANDRGGHDGHGGYPRKEYPPYQPQNQPYRNDNMYRPYHQRY